MERDFRYEVENISTFKPYDGDVSPVIAQSTGERMREVIGTYETDWKQIEIFKAETEKCFHKIDGINASEIEQTAREYIVQKLAECRGDIREDALFDILYEDGLRIDWIEVGINPITEAKTGTLASYMTKAQEYVDRELALSIADRYILIHEKDEGYCGGFETEFGYQWDKRSHYRGKQTGSGKLWGTGRKDGRCGTHRDCK